MEQLFLLSPNYFASKNNYFVDGMHTWSLPGVTCPFCHRSWGAVGVAYPSILLSKLEEEAQYRKPRNVPLKVFSEQQKTIQNNFEGLKYLPPGTQFGPLKGTIKGKYNDFLWLTSWTLLITGRCWELLQNTGLKIGKKVVTKLSSTKVQDVDVFELELELASEIVLPEMGVTDICNSCGYKNLKLPDNIIIDKKSTNFLSAQIFRCSNFPTLIIATLEFKLACEKLMITDIVFQHLNVE